MQDIKRTIIKFTNLYKYNFYVYKFWTTSLHIYHLST